MIYLAGGKGNLAREVYFTSFIEDGVFIEKNYLSNFSFYLAILSMVGDALTSFGFEIGLLNPISLSYNPLRL